MTRRNDFPDAHFSPRCGPAAQGDGASTQHCCEGTTQHAEKPRILGRCYAGLIACSLVLAQGSAFAQDVAPAAEPSQSTPAQTEPIQPEPIQSEPATAQAGATAPGPAANAAIALPMIDPPDEATSRGAFLYVRAALVHAAKAIAAGDDPSLQAADLAPPDGIFPGACVTIREQGGKLLARGFSIGGTRSVEYATQRALEQAIGALPPTRDMLQRKSTSEQLASAIITLELSGQPTPLRPETFRELDSDLDMGVDGVMAIAPTRDGDQSHAVFPLSMLVSTTPPSRAAMSAVSVASGDPALAIAGVKAHEAEAVRGKGVRLYRLRVRQLAQLAPTKDLAASLEPVQIYRGARLSRASDLSTDALRDLLARATDHVLRRATTEAALGQDVAMWDDLRPLEGLQQGFAQPQSKALAAFACLHAASTLDLTASKLAARGEGRRAEQLQNTAQEAAKLAERLLVQQLAGDDLFAASPTTPEDPTEAATWLIALLAGEARIDLGASLRAQPWFAERVQALAARVSQGLRVENEAVVGFADSVPDSARAMFAQSLGMLATSPAALAASGLDAAQLRTLAQGALTQAYLGAGPGDLVSQLPWLWWAQSTLATPSTQFPPALLELRAHIWENQLRESPTPDLVGGIILREQLLPSGKPMPTWQGLRPLTFVASTLRDSELTPADARMSELAKLLGGLRFARQLMTDESAGWAGGLEPARSQGDAPVPTMLWGTKAAPWDHRLPLDASVAGVLLLSETVRSLESM